MTKVEENTKQAIALFESSLEKFVFQEWEFDIAGTEEQPILQIKPTIEQLAADSKRTCLLEIALWEDTPKLIIGEDPTELEELTENTLFKQTLVLVLVELRISLYETQQLQIEYRTLEDEAQINVNTLKEVDKLVHDRYAAS